MARIHKDDTVKIIAGKNKGTTGKVLKVNTKDQTVLVEGVGVGHRHVKPSQYNPKGGKKIFTYQWISAKSLWLLMRNQAKPVGLV